MSELPLEGVLMDLSMDLLFSRTSSISPMLKLDLAGLLRNLDAGEWNQSNKNQVTGTPSRAS